MKTWERRAAVLRAAGRIETFKTDIGQLKAHLDAAPLWRPAAGLAKQCAEALRMIEEIGARLERSLVVVVIGPSGSGKSTLVNALVGAKVSIVTHKVETTRALIRGVAIRDRAQIVFHQDAQVKAAALLATLVDCDALEAGHQPG